MKEMNVCPTSLSNNDRLSTIDVTKGIGFFLVVLGHLVSVNSKASIIIFSFHMPLFYIMSGYLMPTVVTRKSFFKRMTSLSFNYCFFTLFGLIITLIIPMWRAVFSKMSFLYDVVYNTQPECIHVGQIWYLFSMLWVVLFFYGIHFVFANKTVFCALFSILIAGVSIILSKLGIAVFIPKTGECWGIPLKILSGMSGLLFVEIGYLFKKWDLVHKVDELGFVVKIIVSVILLGVTIFFALRNEKVNIALGIYGNLAMYYITSLGGTLSVVFFASLFRGKLADVVGYYGKNSLPLFCFHSMWLYAYAAVLSMIKGYDISIMNNIEMPLCFLGMIVVIISIIPAKIIYDFTGKKLFNIIWDKLKVSLVG